MSSTVELTVSTQRKLLRLFTQELLIVVKAFAAHGYEVRIVGGAVRDMLKQDNGDEHQPRDIDLATDCPPDKMMNVCEQANLHCKTMHTGSFTTIIIWVPSASHSGLVSDGGNQYKAEFELTALRDRQTIPHSSECLWVNDASRRDFTMNAMSCSIAPDQNSAVVCDYFGGMDHLREGRICFIGDIQKNIAQSPDRMLRYFRFHGENHQRGHINNHDESVLTQLSILSKRYCDLIPAEVKWINLKKIIRSSVHAIQAEVSVMMKIGLLDLLLNFDFHEYYKNNMEKNNVDILDSGALVLSAQYQTFHRLRSLHQTPTEQLLEPVTVVCTMLNFDMCRIHQVAKELKWSAQELKLAVFLSDRLQYESPPPWPTLLEDCRLRLRKPDGLEPKCVPLEYLQQLLVLLHRAEEIPKLQTLQPPLFSITARHIKQLKPSMHGAELGKELLRIREIWQKSGFRYNTEQLLAESYHQIATPSIVNCGWGLISPKQSVYLCCDECHLSLQLRLLDLV